jgi:hypothetical protein
MRFRGGGGVFHSPALSLAACRHLVQRIPTLEGERSSYYWVEGEDEYLFCYSVSEPGGAEREEEKRIGGGDIALQSSAPIGDIAVRLCK